MGRSLSGYEDPDQYWAKFGCLKIVHQRNGLRVGCLNDAHSNSSIVSDSSHLQSSLVLLLF